jgi:hypothetical protein
MSDKGDKIKARIKELVSEGKLVLAVEEYRKRAPKGQPADSKEATLAQLVTKYPLRTTYQRWYSTALPVVRQLASDRLNEFISLYNNPHRKQLDALSFGVSDYLQGVTTTTRDALGMERREDYYSSFLSKFSMQIEILESLTERIDDVLADIRSALQAELLDDELTTAEEILSKNHIRAAGALAGVSLEAHLAQVCANHSIVLREKHPALSDNNQALKDNGILDIEPWRQIQWLSDIRNLSVHKKEREPSKDEVAELIDGVRKVVKTVF